MRAVQSKVCEIRAKMCASLWIASQRKLDIEIGNAILVVYFNYSNFKHYFHL